MEVQKEAQRIMTLSVWKMYHSRVQRGGMRLHRSLQLSLVMRNARELYLSARLEDDDELPPADSACADQAADGASRDDQQHACAPEAVTVPERREEICAWSPEPMHVPELREEGGAYAVLCEEAEAVSPAAEPMEEEGASAVPQRRPARPNRKRRSCTLSRRGAAEEAELVPSKKARLGEEGEAPPQPQEGAFPSLAKVLQSGIGGLLEAPPPGDCRGGAGLISILVRAVVAF